MLLKLFVITKWYAQQNTIILCKCKLATGRKPPPATPESRYVTVRTVNGVDFGVVSADASRSHSIRSPCWMRLIHIICTLMRRKWGSRRHIVVCDACIVFCSIYREWNWLPFRLLFMRPKTVNGTQRPNRATSVWGVKGFVGSLFFLLNPKRAFLCSTRCRRQRCNVHRIRAAYGLMPFRTSIDFNWRNSSDNWNCSFID